TGLQWQSVFNLPNPILLQQPVEKEVFNSATDAMNVVWDVDAGPDDTVQISAAFDCYQKSTVLCGPDGSGIDGESCKTGGFSITMQTLFNKVKHDRAHMQPLSFNDAFVDQLIFGTINLDTSVFYTPMERCDVHIHAQIQSTTAIDDPAFTSGNIISSRSDTVTITFAPFTPW
ncbi:MAG: hypothetical protein HRU20_00520, partial [Pseudomonadales bacterium]|nr:hypothetical protein [Pseudomonadales bacterium]